MNNKIITIVAIFLTIIYYLIDILISNKNISTSTSNTSSVKHNERYYQTRLCKKLDGIIEYRLYDKTRVDCLTDKYAIEVDFAKKWAEGIGQTLYYAEVTGKKPAVGLIVGKKDNRFLKRLQKVAHRFNIKIFIIDRD